MSDVLDRRKQQSLTAVSKADAALAQGNPRAAWALYLHAQGLQPSNRKAMEGLRRTARAAFSALTPVSEADMDRLRTLYEGGDHKQTLDFASQLQARHAGDPRILNCVALVLSQQNQPTEAIRYYENALMLDPSYADGYINFGAELIKINRVNDAAEILRRGIELKPDFAHAYFVRGHALSIANRFEEAADSLRLGLRLDKNSAWANALLGSCLVSLGDHKNARKQLDLAIELDPDYVFAYQSLGMFHRFKPDEPYIDAMRALLDKDMSAERSVALHMTMGKALEDVGDVNGAFDYLNRGNSKRRVEIGYSITRDIQLYNGIQASFRDLETAPLDPKDDVPTPIFILGMPRSGSTLVEQILSGHSDVQALGELPFLRRAIDEAYVAIEKTGFFQFTQSTLEDTRRRYYKQLSTLDVSKPFFTDKMPANSLWVGLIRLAFPEAKILYTDRDPIATCWSIFKTNFRSDNLSYACDLGDIGKYYAMNRQIMSFWDTTFPASFLEVNYENLTDDPKPAAQSLLEYCGLEWQEDCLRVQDRKRAIGTASLVQARQGIYTGSSQAWHKFAHHLDPLYQVLRDGGVTDFVVPDQPQVAP